jgi:TPR repeat protein
MQGAVTVGNLAEWEGAADPDKDPLWKRMMEAASRGDQVAILETAIQLVERGALILISFVAEFYERGGRGIPRDPKKAEEWYRRGIELIDCSICHRNLGRMYLTGHGVPRDVEKAREHLERAWSLGEKVSGLYLGNMHVSGLIVPTDLAVAEEYLSPLREKGFVRAHYLLAKIYADRKQPWRALFLVLKGRYLERKLKKKQNPFDDRLLQL